MPRILVFGDSISRGNNDYIYGGWSTLLGNYTEREFSDLSIYDLSVDGETSREILQRFEAEAKHREPESIVFAYGTNDCAILSSTSENQVPVDEFESNTKKLIKIAKNNNYLIAFVGLLSVNEELTNPIPWDEERNYQNQELHKYNRLLKNISEEENCIFIDVMHDVEQKQLPDGLHPDTDGHHKLYNKIKEELTQAKIIHPI